MRVLQVTPFYAPAWAYGGMARATSSLAAALAERGHEVTVATCRLDGVHPARERLAGVEVHRLEGPRWLARRLVPAGRGVESLVDRGRFDVAHLHGHRSLVALQACRALRRAGVPWVFQPHGTWPSHGQWTAAKRAFDACGGRAVADGARAVLALSAAEARDLPRPAEVIGSGVESPGPLAAGRARGGTRHRLLFVGSDAPQKRLSALVPVLHALPDVELRVVGPISAGALAVFGGAAARVVAEGVLAGEALARAYSEADLLVHPAVGEAFGLAPFEAALCGTPSVVLGGHGCGEWLARAGGCVAAREPDLAPAVRARLDDPALGAAEAARVAAFARAVLTWGRVAAAVEGQYRAAACRPDGEARA